MKPVAHGPGVTHGMSSNPGLPFDPRYHGTCTSAPSCVVIPEPASFFLSLACGRTALTARIRTANWYSDRFPIRLKRSTKFTFRDLNTTPARREGRKKLSRLAGRLRVVLRAPGSLVSLGYRVP